MTSTTSDPVTEGQPEALLAALEQGRQQFLELIEPLSDEQLTQPGAAGEWSVKDLLAHLARWEAELVRSLWLARQGRAHTLLTDPAQVDALNARWQRESRGRSLGQALEDFHAVRLQTIRRLEDFSSEELTDPRRYSWLAGTPLWQWIASQSYQHEAEHAGQLRAWLANQTARE
jgi:hypothetical protein